MKIIENNQTSVIPTLKDKIMSFQSKKVNGAEKEMTYSNLRLSLCAAVKNSSFQNISKRFNFSNKN